jgi:transcriptional regulator with XRE-family HTH domain
MALTAGEKIRMFRVAKGMTQQDVAKAMGVSYQNISQYERGVRKPKMSMIRRIASALSVDALEIMGTDDVVIDDFPMEALPEDADEIRRDLNAHFDKLNMVGQLKAVDAVADLAEVPKYRKEGGE